MTVDTRAKQREKNCCRANATFALRRKVFFRFKKNIFAFLCRFGARSDELKSIPVEGFIRD